MDWSPQFIFVLLFSFCRVSSEDRIIRAREYDEEDWHPLRDRPVVSRVIIPMPRIRPVGPPPSSYSTRSDTHATKKRLQLEPSPSNKVEVFAPAPPSILGSFSGFGHATVKAREPAHLKKKPVREQQLSETRPSYTALLLPPPVQDTSKLLYTGFPQDERPAAAFYYEASLRPPPRDIIPPPQSSDLPPNSYYFEGPKTNGLRFQEPTNTYQSGFAPSSPGFRAAVPSSSPFENNYQFQFNSDSIRSQTPAPRPGNIYYSRNPFGDITLSSRRPEVIKPVTEDKPHGKEVFHQLSHLGRPFQNPNIDYNNQRLRDPFLTTVSSSIQLKDEKKQKPKYSHASSGQPFHYTQSDFTPSSHFPGAHSNFFATNAPFSFTTEIYPLTAKTVDIPSESDSRDKQETSTKSSAYISSHKPVSYHDVPVRTYHQPHVEINSYQSIRNESPPFLPTPATNIEPYIKQPDHNEDQYNEIQTALPPTQHHRFPALKKPTEESFADNPSTHNHRFPPYQKPTEESHTENFSTIPSRKPHNSQKHRRRRPTRPTESSNTIATEENQNITDDDSDRETSFIPSNIDYTPEELPTTTIRSHRRKKKPNRTRNREHSNFVPSSTTTTTAEPEPEKYISTQGFHYEFSTPAAATVTNEPDYTVPHTYVSPSQDPYVNTESNYEYSNIRTKDEYNEDTVIGTQNYVSTQPVYDTQSSIEEEVPEVVTTPTPISSSTTTTTASTTTAASEVPSSVSSLPTSYRTRMRSKYGNNTRPRFSVKEYRERLNRGSSTTASPKEEDVIAEDIPKIKYSTRTRGSFQKPSIPSTGPEENLNESTTETNRKYKPRTRYSYKSTSTTPSPDVQVDSPSTTTERSNTFRPSGSRYKPGTGKYYSRYRTSTESSVTEPNETSSSTTRSIRTKGVFSAKRRPFPIRSRNEGANKENEKELAEESKQYRQTVKTIENEIDPVTTVMTKKMDNAVTTTITTSTNTEPVLVGPTGEDISTAQRIADLTSSPSNMYQSNGFRKGISPSSRRTVPQITLATEDPILPLEAFFQSWSNNKDNNAR